MTTTTKAMTDETRRLIAEIDALYEKATKGELRLSRSGYSIKTGWHEEKRILAAAPRAVISANADAVNVNQWIENAEFWCALHNAFPLLAKALREAGRDAEDAKRYRFIRNTSEALQHVGRHPLMIGKFGEELDTAIDAARGEVDK